MEMVETQNQNPTSMGVRYNNPSCLKFARSEREYGAVEMPNGFAKFAPILNGPSTNSQPLTGPAAQPSFLPLPVRRFLRPHSVRMVQSNS
jgi:hypothetical protein